MKKRIPLLILFILIQGCGTGNSRNRTTVIEAFFGDEANKQVIAVNINRMDKVDDYIPTHHEVTHAVNKISGKHKAYISNRGSNALDVIDTNSYHIIKTIALQHHPRSAEAINYKNGLCAVPGADKPMVSLIDINKDEVVSVVGENNVTYPVESHGGKLATGHSHWLDSTHFVLLDRAHRTISTYEIIKSSDGFWHTTKLNEIHTSSSVHKILPQKHYYGRLSIFYATCEGSDSVYPSIIKMILTDHGLVLLDELKLIKEGISSKEMGLHHGDFHPSKKLIYVGSAEGTLFIVSYDNNKMKVIKTIQAGKGAGHTYFVPKRDIAIVINHKDKFVTIINSKTNEKIKDVYVSDFDDASVGRVQIQGHPKYFSSKDGKYFYAPLTKEGVLYKLDLDTLKVVKKLYVDGEPDQGSFVEL